MEGFSPAGASEIPSGHFRFETVFYSGSVSFIPVPFLLYSAPCNGRNFTRWRV
jgi:hypothetical protein